MRAGERVRYIKPESICIGDLIKVSWAAYGVSTSRVGVVARRDVLVHTTEYRSKEDGLLVRHIRYEKPNFVVTLIARAAEKEPTLFELETV